MTIYSIIQTINGKEKKFICTSNSLEIFLNKYLSKNNKIIITITHSTQQKRLEQIIESKKIKFYNSKNKVFKKVTK